MNRVLWTGGWDSTYRMLDLTIIKGREVQPYYVLDDDRSSQPTEMKTMDAIKQMIYEQFPQTRGLIKDTIFFNKDDISPQQDITDKWHRLKSESFMGSQYEWLGRYAEENGINDLELNIHRDDKASVFLYDHVQEIIDGNDSFFSLKSDRLATDLSLFKYYHFPILYLTKIDMLENAKENGFDNIMEKTWFCFNPTWRSTPCGYCNPCRYTREEGLARRVPSVICAKYNKLENAIYRAPSTIKRIHAELAKIGVKR